jgi:hypothetical protein
VGARSPRQLAYGWRDALRARDAAAFGELFARDGVMLDVEHRTADGTAARPLRGRAEIARVAAAWFVDTPVFEYEVLDVLADSTRAAKRWRYRVGEVEVEGVTWLACAGGCIERALVVFDAAALGRDGRVGTPSTR